MSHPDTSPEPAFDRFVRRIMRWLKALVALVSVLILIVGGGVVYVLIISSQTHDALCSLRQDLQQRIAQTEDFIAHPDKFPGVKIDPKLLVPQLEGQKRSVNALAPLGCPDAPPVGVGTSP